MRSDRVKFTVYLDRAAHKELKVLSAEVSRSMQILVETAVNARLAQHAATKKRR